MSEALAKHQLFEYSGEQPFHIYEVRGSTDTGDLLLNHWHEELEIAYLFMGHSRHYINGECVEAQPGRLIVTNSEYIHNIIPDQVMKETSEVAAVVIIIHPKFIEDNFPEYREIYFTNDKPVASPEIKQTIEKMVAYSKKDEEYHHLYGRSLVLELLYLMCKEGTVRREQVDNVNVLKNIERMKGVIQFIEKHYAEHISQTEVADRFYFSSVYFSKYFKKCTGMTFTDYLTTYRVEQARHALLYTDKSVSRIAMENGFSDDRRLIIAFKKKYGTTPLQYRKREKISL